jgi:hypothetical protein
MTSKKGWFMPLTVLLCKFFRSFVSMEIHSYNRKHSQYPRRSLKRGLRRGYGRPIVHALFLLFLLFASLSSVRGTSKGSPRPSKPKSWGITVWDAKFPLKMTEVDFNKRDYVSYPNADIVAKIEQTIQTYVHNCPGIEEGLVASNDIYINTIRLRDSLQTIFVVLLRDCPTSFPNSRVLFYDNVEGKFASKAFNFNLFALYDLDHGKFKPSNLKTIFRITTPEIELVDYDKDGIHDFRFRRLYHNGTANAIQTTILGVKNLKVDTLYFNERGLP